MKIVIAIIGAGLGILIELATPWSDIIMQAINNTQSDPGVAANHPLYSLTKALGIFCAYLFLPSAFALGGFAIG
jgi:hypothetical protein